MSRFLSICTWFLVMPAISWSQGIQFNQKIEDQRPGDSILIGYCTRDSLQGSTFGIQFKQAYNSYQPDQEVINDVLRSPEKLRGVMITIVMATWCSDSRIQVPRFFKLLDNIQLYSRCTIICTNRQKLAGYISLDGMEIVKVPTFIFFRKGKEIGRIIETPKISLDQDFYDIISKK